MAQKIKSPLGRMSLGRIAVYRKLVQARLRYEADIKLGYHVNYLSLDVITRREEHHVGDIVKQMRLRNRLIEKSLAHFGRQTNATTLLETADLGRERYMDRKVYELRMLRREVAVLDAKLTDTIKEEGASIRATLGQITRGI